MVGPSWLVKPRTQMGGTDFRRVAEWPSGRGGRFFLILLTTHNILQAQIPHRESTSYTVKAEPPASFTTTSDATRS